MEIETKNVFYDRMGDGREIYIKTSEKETILYIVDHSEDIQRVHLTPRAISAIMDVAESNGEFNNANEVDPEDMIPLQRRKKFSEVCDRTV